VMISPRMDLIIRFGALVWSYEAYLKSDLFRGLPVRIGPYNVTTFFDHFFASSGGGRPLGSGKVQF
jgi:hypothetical protein